MRRTTFAIPLALALTASGAAGAVIRGTVRVPAIEQRHAAFQPYAGRASSMPMAAPVVHGRVTDAVISIKSIPAEVNDSLPIPATHPRLAQKDQSFVPRVIAIPVGATVDFPNLDPIYHNVFSVSPTRRFDLGKYPRGDSRSIRFDKAGLVNVFCDIHSNMAAFILVLPNRAFTRPDENGAFALPSLPPGRYLVSWWHPDFDGSQREIVLGDADTSIDVSF